MNRNIYGEAIPQIAKSHCFLLVIIDIDLQAVLRLNPPKILFTSQKSPTTIPIVGEFSEVDGGRTRNLRIDSPVRRVSPTDIKDLFVSGVISDYPRYLEKKG